MLKKFVVSHDTIFGTLRVKDEIAKNFEEGITISEFLLKLWTSFAA